jgi:hypothetical protein
MDVPAELMTILYWLATIYTLEFVFGVIMTLIENRKAPKAAPEEGE